MIFWTLHGILKKEPQQDYIIGCCANLVVLDPTDYCVRFAHSSVKQYLTEYQDGFLSVSEDQSRLECGEFCVAYLSFSNFSMSVAKHGHQQTSAAMPNPASFAREAYGSTLRHFFWIPKHDNGTTTISLPRIRTASKPKTSQFKFLNYAIINWAPQTRHIKQSSPVWDKFEQLATNLDETWNFHPWITPGPSKHSRLHSLLGWAVKERHGPLLSIALKSGKYIRQIYATFHLLRRDYQHSISRPNWDTTILLRVCLAFATSTQWTSKIILLCIMQPVKGISILYV